MAGFRHRLERLAPWAPGAVLRKHAGTDKGFEIGSIDSGQALPLTADEGQFLFDINRSDAALRNTERALLRAGADLPWKADDAGRALCALRDRLRAQLPAGRSVLLDTTTVANADACIQNRSAPGAVQLLDLATVVFASVFYDRIILQPHPSLRRKLPSQFHWLDFGDSAERTAVTEELEVMRSKALQRGEAEIWGKIWASALGLDEAPAISLQTHDRWTNSEHFSGLIYDGMIASPSGRALLDPDERGGFLSGQTERTILNDEFAGLLGIPYLASAMRLPVQARLVRDRMDLLPAVADDLLDIVAGVAGALPPGSWQNASPRRFSAPFLLEIAFGRVDTNLHLWHAIAELRAEASDMRRGLREFELEAAQDRLRNPREAFLARYEKLLKGAHALTADRAVPMIDSGLQIASTIATSGGTGTAVRALLKLLLVDAPQLIPGLLGRSHSGVFMLLGLADQAKHLINLADRIAGLWRAIPEENFLPVLRLLAGSRTDSVLGLPKAR